MQRSYKRYRIALCESKRAVSFTMKPLFKDRTLCVMFSRREDDQGMLQAKEMESIEIMREREKRP
jgi:hypothetical protein